MRIYRVSWTYRASSAKTVKLYGMQESLVRTDSSEKAKELVERAPYRAVSSVEVM